MQILTKGTDLRAFFESLERSEGRLLMLDYDGTLSPYRIERDKAVPYPGIREILAELLSAADCRTVIISGRSIKDILSLLGIGSGVEIWGCHGWERMGPTGDYTGPDLDDDQKAALGEAAESATSDGLGERLEVKTACVAIHWRGLGETETAELLRTIGRKWEAIAERTGMNLNEFNGGMEMRPAGMDKGMVVDRLLSESVGPAAYLGDDLTDEDAFRAISGRGIGILVGSELRETAADVWLAPPEELIWFLGRWIEKCGKAHE
jgi:trehalose-phosphatase